MKVLNNFFIKINILIITLFVGVIFMLSNFQYSYCYNNSNKILDGATLGNIITKSTSTIADDNLYDALLNIYKSNNADYIGTSLYTEMFNNSTYTNINLTDKDISSISGLDKLKLNYTTSIDLSFNNITSISYQDLASCTNLINLDVSNNNLSTFVINPMLIESTIKNLKLNNNNLTSIDLRTFKSGTINIDLANNYFTTFDNISFPSTTLLTMFNLNIKNNNIQDFDNNLLVNDKYSILIGVQGVHNKQNEFLQLNENDKITIYKTADENLKIVIKDAISSNTIQTINNSEISAYTLLNLTPGKYILEFYINDIIAYLSSSPSINTEYIPQYFEISPNAPTITFIYRGTEYSSVDFKYLGSITIKCEEENDYQTYYSVDNKNWNLLNSSAEIKTTGTYNLYLKRVYGTYESQVITYVLTSNLNPYIPDVVMIIIIIGLLLVLAFVIAPILKKYVILKK